MNSIKWCFFFLSVTACVEPIKFDVPAAHFQMVVEGFISDELGPYTVKISKSLALDQPGQSIVHVEHAVVQLFDDDGTVEDLVESTPGVYQTGGLIRGQVGHYYHIRLQTAEGNFFESVPDRINPVGEVEEIKHELKTRTIDTNFAPKQADFFSITVDGHAGDGDENYVRWRFTGTYKVLTFPQFHFTRLQGSSYMTPYPCSGYVVEPALGGGKLVKKTECTCCTCYVNQYEPMPQISDGQFVSQKQFHNINVADIPVNNSTFHEKYMVMVEQMSLSKPSYDFFKLIRAQKEGSASLFQPPSGEIRGNVKSMNSNEEVVGIFWATAISRKTIFITPDELPYAIPEIQYFEPCNEYFANSSLDQPQFWQ